MDTELTRPLLTWSIPFPWTVFNIYVHENITFPPFSFRFIKSQENMILHNYTFKRVSIYISFQQFIIWKKEKFIEKILISTLSFRRHLSIDQSATILPPSREETRKRVQRLINKSSDPRELCPNLPLSLWNPKSNDVTNPSPRKKLEILLFLQKKTEKKSSFHFSTNKYPSITRKRRERRNCSKILSQNQSF